MTSAIKRHLNCLPQSWSWHLKRMFSISFEYKFFITISLNNFFLFQHNWDPETQASNIIIRIIMRQTTVLLCARFWAGAQRKGESSKCLLSPNDDDDDDDGLKPGNENFNLSNNLLVSRLFGHTVLTCVKKSGERKKKTKWLEVRDLCARKRVAERPVTQKLLALYMLLNGVEQKWLFHSLKNSIAGTNFSLNAN
jgi:hypothetical protein